MGELSRRLLVTSGNVTGLVERLAKEGLVVREVDAADRRVYRVLLTARGQALFDGHGRGARNMGRGTGRRDWSPGRLDAGARGLMDAWRRRLAGAAR